MVRPTCLAIALLTGCSTRAHLGAVQSTTPRAPTDAVQLSVHENFLVFGLAAQGHLAGDYGSLALSPEVALTPGLLGPQRQPFSPHIAVGVAALQLDWQDRARTFGAGSPFAQTGVSVCSGRQSTDLMHCIGLSLDATHHVRFEADNETYVGLSVVASRWVDPTAPSSHQRPKRKGQKKKRKRGKRR